METFSELLALCEENPPVTGGFPSQRASNAGYGFFEVSLVNKRGWDDLRRHGAHVTSLWCNIKLPTLVSTKSENTWMIDASVFAIQIIIGYLLFQYTSQVLANAR